MSCCALHQGNLIFLDINKCHHAIMDIMCSVSSVLRRRGGEGGQGLGSVHMPRISLLSVTPRDIS